MAACTRLEQGTTFVILFPFGFMLLLLLPRGCKRVKFFAARFFHLFFGCRHLHFTCVRHFICDPNVAPTSRTILQKNGSRTFVFMAGLNYWERQRKQADHSTQSGFRWQGDVRHCWGKYCLMLHGSAIFAFPEIKSRTQSGNQM